MVFLYCAIVLNCDALNFQLCAHRQRCNLKAGTSRCTFGEVLAVNLVECCEISQISQEAGGLDDAVHADTALSQNSLQVLHNLLSLLLNGGTLDLAGLGVQRNLTRSKDKLLGLDGLRVGADRSRCVRRRNNILFHNEQVPFLDHFAHKWSDLFALMMIPEMCSFFKLNLRTI